MKIKLDHFYGDSNVASATDLTALTNKVDTIENKVNTNESKVNNIENKANTNESKVNSLSNIAVKNNIANQIIPQQRINQAPTQDQNIFRLQDTKFERVITHWTLENAGTVWQWGLGNKLEDGAIHEFSIKAALSDRDYEFNWTTYITNKNYKNIGPIIICSDEQNGFNEGIKFKVWVQDSAFKCVCSKNLAGFQVYLRKWKSI